MLFNKKYYSITISFYFLEIFNYFLEIALNSL